jgi:two-component system sensor histidine kinase ChvG
MADPYDDGERIFWTRRVSLTVRILAVNIVALGLLAGSLFYLDSYRNGLVAERYGLARGEVEIAADALGVTTRSRRRDLIARIGTDQKLRLQLYDAKGKLIADSFKLAEPSFELARPANDNWYNNAARSLDTGMDYLLGTPPVPDYPAAEPSDAAGWPEVSDAREVDATVIRQRMAPDRTPIITAASPVGVRGDVLLTTRNATDITQKVRDARQTLAIVVGAALLTSVLLSLFLARTIIMPLRALVRAAVRVRLGREREVVVPRLPERGDEIGLLARAISDMTTALRHRIDAVETFAADVAHEIKNPLASLRSALETLDKVEDPELRRQLSDIAAHDVKRIDRLVTEISEASRIDAELSRTVFEPVDMVRMVKAIAESRDLRGANGGVRIAVSHSGSGDTCVAGDPQRLERVLENLLDNAASFSPPGGTIQVSIDHTHGDLEIAISDEGPGIPVEAREEVFQRFHSLRPESEAFGSHSGLGLAIARTIVEAHDGSLTAEDRTDGRSGARMVIVMPEWRNR